MHILSALLLLSTVSAAVPGDLVTSLPGYGAPPTRWYSGYLDILGAFDARLHMHYIFIESPNPTSDPVAVWLNGGPGCSSLEGLFQEMGPLWVDEQDPTKLIVNSNAWTNVSSMLFLEAPACVGYSYTDDIIGCSHNDSSQAVDNANALREFFTLFPEYSSLPLFLTGESYAGIYVPTLAQQIVLGNAAGKLPKLNLQGIAVGNGCLGSEIGVCAFDYKNDRNTNMPYFFGHGLISPVTYNAVVRDCPEDATTAPPACQADFDAAAQEIGNVNIYNIYGDCVYGNQRRDEGRVEKATGLRVYSKAPVPMREGGPIACIDETIQKYLGRPDVAAALHVNGNLHWAVCGSNSSFDYTRTEKDERVDVYPDIWKAGVRVLIYNGEADACVPYLDNEAWVRSLNFTVAKPWTSWESLEQNAGYVTQYTSPSGSDFDFATVKGAGHMVSQRGWPLCSGLVPVYTSLTVFFPLAFFTPIFPLFAVHRSQSIAPRSPGQ